MLDPVQPLEYETGLFVHIPRLHVDLSVHERRELQLALSIKINVPFMMGDAEQTRSILTLLCTLCRSRHPQASRPLLEATE